MSRTYTLNIILTALLTLAVFSVRAGNVVGGDLSYRYISGTSYEVSVDLYLDCSGGGAPSNITLNVTRSGPCSNSQYTLPSTGFTDVTTACPTATTTCQGGSNFGVRRHTFMDTIDVQVNCGLVTLSVARCCRSESLTNMDNSAGVFDLILTSRLSSGLLNTSPQFNSEPALIVPNSTPVQLDFSATGRNGDSLVYAMETPLLDTGTPLTYYPGYSTGNPLTSNGSYFFNTQTGIMSFVSTQNQQVALSVKVYQYRNDSLVGTAHRDIQVVTSDSLNTNNPPTLSGIDNTTNLAKAFNGGDTVRFSIYSDDADVTQQLQVTVLQNLPGATVDTVAGLNPYLEVEWITTLSDISANPYPFTVQVEDNGCDYIQQATKTYFIYITSQLTEVWPGDANNDMVADMKDLLSIGLAHGTTGPVRPGASNSWVAQTAPDWAVSFINGTDYKFADCNGNGLIDSFDTQAILDNYSLMHAKSGSQSSSSGPPLFMDPTVDTVSAGSTLQIPVLLGSPTNAAGDVYGVTFSIFYNSDYVVPGSASVAFDTCWLNDGAGIITLFKELPGENRIDVGITRINQVAVNGNGELCIVSVVMQDDITGKTDVFATVDFGLDNVNMINADGFALPVAKQDTSLVIQDVVAVEEVGAGSTVSIYPNPAYSKLYLESTIGLKKVTIYNSMGTVVYTGQFNQTQKHTIDIGQLPAGVYFINLKDLNGHMYTQRIVVQTSR